MTGYIDIDPPEEAKVYIQTIDMQIASITNFERLQDDYDHALDDLVAQLRILKDNILADPSISIHLAPCKDQIEADHVNHTADPNAPIFSPTTTGGFKRCRISPTVECSTCLEMYRSRDTTTLKCCGTVYCISCFREWFVTSLSKHHLPKCCEIGIVPKEYPGKLTTQIIARYKNVVKELEAERKLWCANGDCGAFIKIDVDTAGFTTCSKCRRKTCATCAGSVSMHKGRRKMCPDHLTDQILESAMQANNWKRCPGCFVVIQKNGGCNNISCTCGTMFCFWCGMAKASEAGRCGC